MSNKHRVFVAVYTRPDASELASLSSARSKPKPHNFHWGIWVEPKNSTGAGTTFELQDSVAFSTVQNPFGWRFQLENQAQPSPLMLGRIMIGKVPEEMSTNDVGTALRQVPLPSDPQSAIADGVTWIIAAIEELQHLGCSESFSIETFMDDAVGFATTWQSKKSKEAEKVNYTWSRTFP